MKRHAIRWEKPLLFKLTWKDKFKLIYKIIITKGFSINYTIKELLEDEF
jgi:hypothetical protein